jgi:hypothetical protein
MPFIDKKLRAALYRDESRGIELIKKGGAKLPPETPING